MKINKVLFAMGLLALIAFFFASYVIHTQHNIRIKGKLVYAPIVKTSQKRTRHGGRHQSCYVLIDNKTIYAGSPNHAAIGDSIAVRYIPGQDDVVQECIHPNRFYLFYALASPLLILGVMFIIESFKGKSMSQYYIEEMRQQIKRREKIKRLKSKFGIK